MKYNVSVRELKESDIPLIINYWYNADDTFLIKMGVDINKIPSEKVWKSMLVEQMAQPYNNKKSYYIIWEFDGKPAGHSHVNKIIFGREAYMHFHLWNHESRKLGYGTELVKMTLPSFFENLKLKYLYCEPYALNPSPNKALNKIGFEFIKEYITIPGFLNVEQKVNLWLLTYEKFKKLA